MLQLWELWVILQKHQCKTYETFTKALQNIHLKGQDNKGKIRLNEASFEVGK